MRSARDFFAPLAIGAPAPLREVPVTPSRVIHSLDPSNERMTAKVAAMVGTAEEVDFGPTRFWTRLSSLDSPWFLGDGTTIVPAIGAQLDVVMVPKVEGAEDIHYIDRMLAQLEAKARLTRPILVHAILETARGVANVEEIGPASPRMQGLSLGPAAPRAAVQQGIEDDASMKQCGVLLDLADQLAAVDPEARS